MERVRKQRARSMSFVEFVNDVTNGRFIWYQHCVVLAARLQQVADGEIRRLMVFMPPRHGKSELVSRLFPAYYLYRHPHRKVGLTGYGTDLVNSYSRAVRRNYRSSGGEISGDASAVKWWELPEGGELWAASLRGEQTGKGFHLGIVDDPIKNAKAAESPAERAYVEDWWDSTFYMRRARGDVDAIVIVQTRWHWEDLAGMLLEREEEGNDPQHWHIVSMAALAEPEQQEFPDTCTVEPDWRKPGEALCPEIREAQEIRRYLKQSPFWAYALYQQRPTPREGGFYKRAWFTFVQPHEVPKDTIWERGWDRAATQDGGDWTAGVKVGYSPSARQYYVAHVSRFQMDPGPRDAQMKRVAKGDGKRVYIVGEQGPGDAGKSDARHFVKLFPGYTVRVRRATGTKEDRGSPAAAQASAGAVSIVVDSPADRWNSAFLDELCSFPKGANDDQADGFHLGFTQVTLRADAMGDEFAGLVSESTFMA